MITRSISCIATASLLALSAAACAPTKNFAMSCNQFVGRPVTELLKGQGAPSYTVDIDQTRSGLVYTASHRIYTAPKPYYEVNYMIEVDNKQSVSRPVTTICSGTYIILKSNKEKSTIIDVWPIR